MRYKLNEQDYRRLWLVATPKEIAAEFGDRAHHYRHIYKIFKRFEGSQVAADRKLLREEAAKVKPEFVSKDEAKQIFDTALDEARQEHFEQMWKIINNYENRWN